MIQAILLLSIGLMANLVHPFHISICEIEHDEKSKSLQITSRIFQDDLEVALNHISSTSDYFNQRNPEETKADLEEYFDQHLQIRVNNQPLKHKFLGFEIEENVVWCYLEIEQINSLSEMSITYSVLIDTFNDQINLAHIRYGDKVKSLKFQKDQLSGKAAFTN